MALPFIFITPGTTGREQAKRPFVQVKDHVLLPQAAELEKVDAAFRDILTAEEIRAIISVIPDEWLLTLSHHGTPDEIRGRICQVF